MVGKPAVGTLTFLCVHRIIACWRGDAAGTAKHRGSEPWLPASLCCSPQSESKKGPPMVANLRGPGWQPSAAQKIRTKPDIISQEEQGMSGV